jgi:hypothetical protein
LDRRRLRRVQESIIRFALLIKCRQYFSQPTLAGHACKIRKSGTSPETADMPIMPSRPILATSTMLPSFKTVTTNPPPEK